MNSEREILQRTLRAYPVRTVKESFELDIVGQAAILNQVSQRGKNEILDFAFANFGFLHQHIYLFDLSADPNGHWEPLENQLYSTSRDGDWGVYNFIFDVNYVVVNGQNGNREELKFQYPVVAHVSADKLIIKINTLERSVSDYFEDRVFLISKSITEPNIVDSIKDSLPIGIAATELDINKGIKTLWEEKFIDAAYAQFRKSKSTSTEAMDEDNLLRDVYPEEYELIMRSPIRKNVFRILTRSDEFLSNFTVEPSLGKLSITKFANHVNSVDKLIKLILNKN